MTGPVLLPGFYGKLPSAGDFVSRNLPPAFTRRWDRWLARNVPDLPQAAPPLFFRHANFSGVVLPSRDRIGRRFPLTLAVAGTPRPADLVPLAATGTAAIANGLSPDTLATRLAAQPVEDGPPPPAPFLLWTANAAPRAVDPDAAGPVLSALLGEAA